jgi:hypothetical protein
MYSEIAQMYGSHFALVGKIVNKDSAKWHSEMFRMLPNFLLNASSRTHHVCCTAQVPDLPDQ